MTVAPAFFATAGAASACVSFFFVVRVVLVVAVFAVAVFVVAGFVVAVVFAVFAVFAPLAAVALGLVKWLRTVSTSAGLKSLIWLFTAIDNSLSLSSRVMESIPSSLVFLMRSSIFARPSSNE